MTDADTDARTRDAEETIQAIDAQLGAGQDVVRVGDHGIVHSSYGWAIARSIRHALDTGGTFDTPEQDPDGCWWAVIRIPLGRFPA